MRPLTEAERDAFDRWHQHAGEHYGSEETDAHILANLASELFLADHFERITPERLEDIGFRQIGSRLILEREGDTIACHLDGTDWAVNGLCFSSRRLEPRFMGELQDIMFKLWGPQ